MFGALRADIGFKDIASILHLPSLLLHMPDHHAISLLSLDGGRLRSLGDGECQRRVVIGGPWAILAIWDGRGRGETIVGLVRPSADGRGEMRPERLT
jgi:hypothetical protein